jgi:hypothetical protein
VTTRLAARGLSLAGGLLMVAGAFLPWALVPVGRGRLPLPGLLGPGGLTLLAGLWLLARPRAAPLLVLPVAILVALGTPAYGEELARHLRGSLIGLQLWIAPLNRLLEQSRIGGIEVVDLGVRLPQYIGPGVAVTAWGGWLAALGQLARLFLAGEGPPVLRDRLLPLQCRTCSLRIPRARGARFCPGCGASLGGPPLCRACLTPAAPEDRYCASCGNPLAVVE